MTTSLLYDSAPTTSAGTENLTKRCRGATGKTSLTSTCHPSTGEQNEHRTAPWEPTEEITWTFSLTNTTPSSIREEISSAAVPNLQFSIWVFETTMPGISIVPLALLILMSKYTFTFSRPQIILQIIYIAIVKRESTILPYIPPYFNMGRKML